MDVTCESESGAAAASVKGAVTVPNEGVNSKEKQPLDGNIQHNVEKLDDGNVSGREEATKPVDTASKGIEEREKQSFSSRKRQRREKRGMKPRSKRNRKRPSSSQIYSIENQVIKTNVGRIQMDGRPVDGINALIRTVVPYPFTFATYAKARWIGRKIIDVYVSEFGSFPESYYRSAIEQGRILVSDNQVDPNYEIKDGDCLSHTVHRHEPPVAVTSTEAPYIKVIAETDDVVVCNKPGTLPVHTCGGYRVNSLMSILEGRYGKLYTIHRLDRLTSGLIVLAKTSEVARKWGKVITERGRCRKYYLARVRGKFPLGCSDRMRLARDRRPPIYGQWEESQSPKEPHEDARRRNAYVYWVTNLAGEVQPGISSSQVFASQHELTKWMEILNNGKSNPEAHSKMLWFHLACPTRVVQPKDGIFEAGPFDDLDSGTYVRTVKPSETAFSVIRYCKESDSTIVLCRLITGRTHQIRLHLQHLGHPISNDPNYGGSIWSGDSAGEIACRRAREILLSEKEAMSTDMLPAEQGRSFSCCGTEKNGTEHGFTVAAKTDEQTAETIEGANDTTTTDVPATEEEVAMASSVTRGCNEDIHDFIKRTCVWCARSRGGSEDHAMLEFLVRSRGIWLHSFHYEFSINEGKRDKFTTDPPEWSGC